VSHTLQSIARCRKLLLQNAGVEMQPGVKVKEDTSVSSKPCPDPPLLNTEWVAIVLTGERSGLLTFHIDFQFIGQYSLMALDAAARVMKYPQNPYVLAQPGWCASLSACYAVPEYGTLRNEFVMNTGFDDNAVHAAITCVFKFYHYRIGDLFNIQADRAVKDESRERVPSQPLSISYTKFTRKSEWCKLTTPLAF
jgi:hypothetical protein